MHLDGVDLHYLGTDEFYLVIRSSRNLIDEVPNRQLGALRQNIFDMAALDKLRVLDSGLDVALIFASIEGGGTVLACLPEQQDAFLEHQEVHEQALLFSKQMAVFVLELDHFSDLFVVVVDAKVRGSPVNDHTNSLLYVLEGLETLAQISDQFRQLLGSRLADVGLIDNQYQLHLFINV